MIGNRTTEKVEESAKKLHCKKVRLDGTKSIDENVGIVMRTLAEMDAENTR